jgi:hypothetical protein
MPVLSPTSPATAPHAPTRVYSGRRTRVPRAHQQTTLWVDGHPTATWPLTWGQRILGNFPLLAGILRDEILSRPIDEWRSAQKGIVMSLAKDAPERNGQDYFRQRQELRGSLMVFGLLFYIVVGLVIVVGFGSGRAFLGR